MSGGVLLQAVVSGLALGTVFALVAVGFTLVWSLTRVLAFAHGDLVVAAALTGVLVVVGRTPVALSLGVARSIAVVVVALAVGMALSLLVYAVAVRPFLDRREQSDDVMGWVAGGVTAGLVIRTALGLALPAAAYAVPDPLHFDELTTNGTVGLPGGGVVGVRVFPVLVVGLLVAVAADWFIARSRLGGGGRGLPHHAGAAPPARGPPQRAGGAPLPPGGPL